jgi:two-component system sensor histidine kinase CpxA
VDLPAPRLYLRMALYIGAALAAFVTLAAGSVILVASMELRSYVEARQSTLGQEAAEVLAGGGVEALRRWLGRADLPRDVTIFVLDESSRDVLGRALPGYLEEFVRTSVVGPPEDPRAHYRPVRLAPQLIAGDGTRYAFLVLPNRISLWGSPATALGLVLAALLVVASVAWLIARAFGRPIGELQGAVRRLASGQLETRLPAQITGRHDELGALASDFNSMADQITQLLQSRQQLMAELSHELRSPLARLQAALALAGHREQLDTAGRERIEQEVQRLDRVIGDLLRFSRLGTSAAIQRRLLRLDQILAELTSDEEIEAAARDCHLQLEAERDLAVVGDPDLLRSGLENILRNAIRYAPSGSTVDIEAREVQGSVVITIADRGPGVPAEFLQQIFEPYFRVPRPGATDAGGTGLGLAIARRVFEAHGGSVGAAHRHGGGLAVSARIPAAELG